MDNYLNEQLLIKALQQQESVGYTELVEKYQHLVFNTVLSITQNNIEAEDTAQEVFIQVFESINQFKGDCKLSTWMYRIAITKALDWQRKKSRKKRFAVIENLFGSKNELKYDRPNFNHPGITLENREKAALLFKAINSLPDNQKIAFTLNKVEGLSYIDVAEVMQVTVASIEALLHRAKQKLRKELSSYYHE